MIPRDYNTYINSTNIKKMIKKTLNCVDKIKSGRKLENKYG